MTFNEQKIEAGSLTLRDIQNLVDGNTSKAMALGVELSWYATGRHVTGRIRKNGVIIWSVTASTISFPFNLCRMYELINQRLDFLIAESVSKANHK